MKLKAIRIVEGTKITHDQWECGVAYDYDDLVQRNIPAIGIPAAPNGIVIIDVDTRKTHKYDGRDAWAEFAVENHIPDTYTVTTPSGGFHFYFKLPDGLNPRNFTPRKNLLPGVDVVYNGYVLSPPTKGYVVSHGTPDDMEVAPLTLLTHIVSRPTAVDDLGGAPSLDGVHQPFTSIQLERLKKQLEWCQVNVSLTYDQWFRGLTSLKAGIRDQELLETYALMWTRNQSYQEGDDEQALAILERVDANGGVGPATILTLMRELTGTDEAEEMPISMLSQADICQRAGVHPTVGKDGRIQINPNETNIAAIIDAIPQFSARNMYYDTRMDTYVYNGQQVDDEQLIDIITPVLQDTRKGLGFYNFRRTNVASAVQVLMTSRRKDPHAEWLDALVWDGVERIDTFFPRYAMTTDDVYARALGRNLWVALAARGLDPGCKMDNIIILEGREGIRKSSLVEAIGGDYYMSLSTDERINGTEALRKMHMSTVVEIPELVALINRQGEEVKAILSTNKDRLRGLYAKKAYDRRRGFVIIGTTNAGEYLPESMGERRYWPIRVGVTADGIDLIGVKADRTQLFAEGVHRYKRGETFWEIPDEWKEEIDQRRIKDPLAPVVEEILVGSVSSGIQRYWTLHDIYSVLQHRELLGRGLNNRVADRLKTVLRQIGATNVPVSVKGSTQRKWTIVVPEMRDIVDELV